MTGTQAPTSKTPADLIEIHRRLAYLGGVGTRREQFCIDYTARKQQNMASMALELQKFVAAEGKTVGCSKGCSSCCYVYVVATLQECEAIVYHLYKNEEKLRRFTERFPIWHDRVNTIWDTFSEISRLQQMRMAGTASAEDERAFTTVLESYQALDNPCPFLEDGACAIYEVRPYVCASLVATTPPANCRRGHAGEPPRTLQVPVPWDHDVTYFAGTGLKQSVTCLPALVYELLASGYGFLGSLPWLAGLKRQLSTDSAVQKTLREYRAQGVAGLDF